MPGRYFFQLLLVTADGLQGGIQFGGALAVNPAPFACGSKCMLICGRSSLACPRFFVNKTVRIFDKKTAKSRFSSLEFAYKPAKVPVLVFLGNPVLSKSRRPCLVSRVR